MSKATKIEFEVAGEHPDTGDEVMLNVRCAVTPGSPGRTSGPPEDCYEPEPCLVEDLKVFRAADDDPDPNYKHPVPESQWPKYGIDLEMLQELAVQKAADLAEGQQEDEYERRRERDLDRD